MPASRRHSARWLTDQRMRLYPQPPADRRRTVVRDVLVIVCLIAFAALAIHLRDEIAGLAQLGTGVNQTGRSVRHEFDSVAGAVSGAPILGGPLVRELRSAAALGAGAAISATRHAQSDVGGAADWIGWLGFPLPAALLLAAFLPCRIRQIRRMRAAAKMLHPDAGLEQRRLIAERAAFSLPYSQLLLHTRDPLGDLQAGRYHALLAAALGDAALNPTPHHQGDRQ